MSERPARRILFLTPQRPNRTRQGAAIRNWNLMARLADRHRLDLLTFDALTEGADVRTARGKPDEPWERITTVPAPRRSSWRRLGVLALSGRADMADRLWSPLFARRLHDALAGQTYDIVQGEGIELARYLLLIAGRPPADGAAGTGPLLVFDDHNAEHMLQRRAALTGLRQPRRWLPGAYSLLQWDRLRRFERTALRRCDLTVCVSEADAEALQALAPERPILVAPNGVDTTYYAPGTVTGQPPRFDLVFSGTLDYRPNIDAVGWFMEAVWPRLLASGKRRDPNDGLRGLRLALVGRNPPTAMTRLVARGGVTVTGSVADDRPYFAGATVYILPMRYGGGVRLKLLNALAMGCAVVSTTAGCEGVAVRDGEHLLVADGAEAFAAAVERLLDDQALRARLGAAGRAFVRERYEWAGIVARLEAGYDAAFAIRDSPKGRLAPAPPPLAESTPEAAPEGALEGPGRGQGGP